MTESRASLPARIAAFLAGAVILLIATAVSLGFVLLAPLGIWVMHRIRRARRRPVSLFDRWIGAVTGTTVAMLLVTVAVVAKIPADVWHEIRQSADSASAEAQKQPPPAWLRHVVPSASQPAMQTRQPMAVGTIAMVWGIGFGIGIAGVIVGSVGWVGTILLIFCVSGEWVRAPPVVNPEVV